MCTMSQEAYNPEPDQHTEPMTSRDRAQEILRLTKKQLSDQPLTETEKAFLEGVASSSDFTLPDSTEEPPTHDKHPNETGASPWAKHLADDATHYHADQAQPPDKDSEDS